ncbi:MAG: hypothetical protein KGL35_05340 [Bradyrhizobium sp.]|nr:hypothetical protein [Bradyrhizobium sp.]
MSAFSTHLNLKSGHTMNTGTFLGYRNDKGEEMHCAHAKCISPEMCLKGCKCPVAKSTPPMSDDLIRELRHPFANKLLCTKAADEIERLRARNAELSRVAMSESLANARRDEANEELRKQLAEWQQAASVEAALRREFLARAEKVEAERDDALKRLVKARADAIEECIKAVENYGLRHTNDAKEYPATVAAMLVYHLRTITLSDGAAK